MCLFLDPHRTHQSCDFVTHMGRPCAHILRLDQLTCLVVDELHMVADKQRGYLLEIMLRSVASI